MAHHIRRSTIGEPKLLPGKRSGWTRTVCETFLNHLAATCNVTTSCEAAGMSLASAYSLRRRDAAFAAQWRAALLTGYDRLEAALLEHATRALTLVEHGEVPDVPFSPEAAIRILGLHHARLAAGERGLNGRPPVRRATSTETDAAIMKQLAALDRRLKTRAPK